MQLVLIPILISSASANQQGSNICKPYSKPTGCFYARDLQWNILIAAFGVKQRLSRTFTQLCRVLQLMVHRWFGVFGKSNRTSRYAGCSHRVAMLSSMQNGNTSRTHHAKQNRHPIEIVRYPSYPTNRTAIIPYLLECVYRAWICTWKCSVPTEMNHLLVNSKILRNVCDHLGIT